ncbi:hypothetical protein FS837_011266 [Tulasnella sp. UAMH 9824]|nr:hypothetical protein FS837_011266 [Tulasnella sp. UAMH 9824]
MPRDHVPRPQTRGFSLAEGLRRLAHFIPNPDPPPKFQSTQFPILNKIGPGITQTLMMALPTAGPNSATTDHGQTPPSNMNLRAMEMKTSILNTLKHTDWPMGTLHDVQTLIEKMNALPAIEEILKDETQISEEVKGSIEQVLNKLESVHAGLKRESNKYGDKRKRSRKGLKELLSRIDAPGCSKVLVGYRNEVEECSGTLSNLRSNLNIVTEYHTIQVLSAEHGQTRGASLPGQPINGASERFRFSEGVLGTLPVVENYIGAAAKVGMAVAEMVQVMDDNAETAVELGTHVSRLSELLNMFSNQLSHRSPIVERFKELQRELQIVRNQIEEQRSQGFLIKLLYSNDRSENLKKLRDRIRVAFEEIQLLINLKASILVEELRKYRHLYGWLGRLICTGPAPPAATNRQD